MQRRGDELLRRSNDVHVVEDTHPAFARILSEITPDEARILRFLYLDGPQPSIDVRTNRPLGIGSELVAGGLNMIGEHAGCRNVDQIHQYLTNLARLGLIEFSKEQVTNPQRYQVVEAQPKVTEAMKRAGRMPKAVHRSIHLNEFGRTFCEACLPVGDVRTPRQRLMARPSACPRALALLPVVVADPGQVDDLAEGASTAIGRAGPAERPRAGRAARRRRAPRAPRRCAAPRRTPSRSRRSRARR